MFRHIRWQVALIVVGVLLLGSLMAYLASAYSVRPTRDARVSTPLAWAEVPDCEPAAFTIGTVPDRFAALVRTLRFGPGEPPAWRELLAPRESQPGGGAALSRPRPHGGGRERQDSW